MSTPFSPPPQYFSFDSTQLADNNSDGILSQDTAIRRFCSESTEKETEGNHDLFEIETWSSSFDSSSPPCSVNYMDEDSGFIDSIINASLCEESTMQPVLIHDPDPDPAIVNKGLQLVHLLLACAEAVACRDTALAASTLGQIRPRASPNGDSLQRVSFWFALGLKSRLALLQNVKETHPIVTNEEKMEAFHHLYKSTPYIAFAFMAANDAICHAARGKDYLHIVDLGMSHSLQWPALIRALASRPEGPPARIRITGVASPDSTISELESNMQLLTHEASTIGLQVEYDAINEPPSPSLLTAELLDVRQGEALFFNSVTRLHRYAKEGRGSLKAVLVAIKKLKPAVLAVVEQDANHNGPFFLARFLESLHYYSALFDSLEAGLPRPSLRRMEIERSCFGDEIRNIVACEGGERVERHERADQWRRRLGRAGFQGVGIGSVEQARTLVSAYGCDGYTVGNEKGCLLLGWRGRPIMWASAWQVGSAGS